MTSLDHFICILFAPVSALQSTVKFALGDTHVFLVEAIPLFTSREILAFFPAIAVVANSMRIITVSVTGYNFEDCLSACMACSFPMATDFPHLLYGSSAILIMEHNPEPQKYADPSNKTEEMQNVLCKTPVFIHFRNEI